MEEDLNLLDYWNLIVKWKKSIMTIVGIVTVACAIISLCIPKTYKADATLMPVGGNKNNGMMAMAQAALGGMLGGMSSSSSSSNQVLAILQSRTLAERVIAKYGIEQKLFGAVDNNRPPEDIIRVLKGKITFIEDKKSQLVRISSVSEDPKMAADLVNQYIQEGMAFINDNAFTSAKRNRIFIEEQLEMAKKDLLEAGKGLTDFYDTKKISNIRPMVDVDISLNKSGEVPAEFENDQIKKMQLQLNDVNQKIEKSKVVKDVPQQVYLQYLTLRRELLNQVHALLTQQYEMAKIEEKKEDLNFQVIDWARVPVRKYQPKRAQIVIAAFIGSFIFSIFYVFFRDYLEKLKRNS